MNRSGRQNFGKTPIILYFSACKRLVRPKRQAGSIDAKGHARAIILQNFVAAKQRIMRRAGHRPLEARALAIAVAAALLAGIPGQLDASKGNRFARMNPKSAPFHTCLCLGRSRLLQRLGLGGYGLNVSQIRQGWARFFDQLFRQWCRRLDRNLFRIKRFRRNDVVRQRIRCNALPASPTGAKGPLCTQASVNRVRQRARARCFIG